MARLRDFPKVIRHIGIVEFGKRVWNQVNNDNLFVWASALAYSWLFAVFPFFIFLLTLLPYLPDEYKSEASYRIEAALRQLPAQAYKTVWAVVQDQLNKLLNAPPKGVGLIGLLVTLWAASGGMAMTMSALDKTYDVKKPRPYYTQRPLAIVLTIIAATLVVSVIVLIPIGTLATRWLISHTELASDWLAKRMGPLSTIPTFVKDHVEVLVAVWQIIRFSLAFVLLFGLVSTIYHFGPNIRQRYRVLTPGSVFTILVWLLLGSLFRVYIDKFGKYNETYGAVGGVAILLLFFYIDALVLLVGAEINSETDFECLKVERGTYDFRAAERKMIQEAQARDRAKSSELNGLEGDKAKQIPPA